MLESGLACRRVGYHDDGSRLCLVECERSECQWPTGAAQCFESVAEAVRADAGIEGQMGAVSQESTPFVDPDRIHGLKGMTGSVIEASAAASREKSSVSPDAARVSSPPPSG